MNMSFKLTWKSYIICMLISVISNEPNKKAVLQGI
jgi:hypothetical protein